MIIRKVIAFPISLIGYVIGFWIGSILGTLSVKLAIILPSGTNANSAGLTGAAIGANIFALVAFSWVYPSLQEDHKTHLAVLVMLILLALGYGASCFYYDTPELLWFSIISIIVLALAFVDVKKDLLKSKEGLNYVREHDIDRN